MKDGRPGGGQRRRSVPGSVDYEGRRVMEMLESLHPCSDAAAGKRECQKLVTGWPPDDDGIVFTRTFSDPAEDGVFPRHAIEAIGGAPNE